MWKLRYYVPLAGFVLPTVAIGYGVVIPVGDAVIALRDSGASEVEQATFAGQAVKLVEDAAAGNPRFATAARWFRQQAERIHGRTHTVPGRDAFRLARAFRSEAWAAAHRILEEVANESAPDLRRRRMRACREVIRRRYW